MSITVITVDADNNVTNIDFLQSVPAEYTEAYITALEGRVDELEQTLINAGVALP